MDLEEWKKNIKTAITTLINDFHKNPYYYIYEADLQAKLYSLLRSIVTDSDIEIDKVTISEDWDINDEKTILIHTQCATDKESTKSEEKRGKYLKQHLDIGIWDAVNDSEKNKLLKKDYKDKPILFGIEIKYWWSKNFKKLSEKHSIFGDVNKLYGLSLKYGYALLFLPKCEQDLSSVREYFDKLQEKNPTRTVHFYIMTKNNYYLNGEPKEYPTK